MNNAQAIQEMANQLHDQGYSDAALAELLGVGREYVNRVRNGRRPATIDFGNRLADLLGLDPFEEDEPAYPQYREVPTTPRVKRQPEPDEIFNTVEVFGASYVITYTQAVCTAVGAALVLTILFISVALVTSPKRTNSDTQ